jgi:putative transposase
MPDWPHAPVHRFTEAGVYFVTGATHHKQHFYRSPPALDALQELLFAQAKQHECELQAWALLSNHYHLVIDCQTPGRIRPLLSRFHSEAAVAINRSDGVQGRKVWFQFWDIQLTYEKSWLARLRYTHENAVRHGLVGDARGYRWCSAAWFEETAKPAFVETVKRIKIDRINVYDDFALLPR